MTDDCIKLIARMVIAAMAREPIDHIYEQYLRERYLHVTIREILEAKEEREPA